jgi:hypothetical protein
MLLPISLTVGGPHKGLDKRDEIYGGTFGASRRLEKGLH